MAGLTPALANDHSAVADERNAASSEVNDSPFAAVRAAVESLGVGPSKVQGGNSFMTGAGESRLFVNEWTFAILLRLYLRRLGRPMQGHRGCDRRRHLCTDSSVHNLARWLRRTTDLHLQLHAVFAALLSTCDVLRRGDLCAERLHRADSRWWQSCRLDPSGGIRRSCVVPERRAKIGADIECVANAPSQRLRLYGPRALFGEERGCRDVGSSNLRRTTRSWSDRGFGLAPAGGVSKPTAEGPRVREDATTFLFRLRAVRAREVGQATADGIRVLQAVTDHVSAVACLVCGVLSSSMRQRRTASRGTCSTARSR